MKNYIIPDWPAPKNVRAFSTTRLGGYSQPPFDSFNFSKSSGDKLEDVMANRQKLISDLQLPTQPVWLHQVHGADVLCLDQTITNPTGDAAYTSKQKQVCLISTADCLPILFCDAAGTKVAAAHAGWRGLAADVIEATLNALQIEPEKILVWLGPAIGPNKFEVGDEVRQQFLQVNSAAQAAFTSTQNPKKWLANLYLLARQRLHHCNVTQIYGGNYCTYTDAERFFSYRRDQGKTGRMASLIWFDNSI